MPSVKVCLWNIQDYGKVAPKYDGVGYIGGNALRNGFIARFVAAKQIDVLMIQEVKADGDIALANLQQRLNGLMPVGERDWAYSACGSTIKADDVQQAETEANVGWTSGQRMEGYAVLWRRNQAARFSMVDGLFPIADMKGPASVVSPLNMSELGRPTGRVTGGKRTFGATGGFTLARPYPYRLTGDLNNLQETSPYELLNFWPKLNYPPTAKNDFAAFRWAGARRPVYVVLKLAGAANNLCPVAVYHAPSNRVRSSWGAYVSGLSRELYATNTVAGTVPDHNRLQVVRNSLFGGDFNCQVTSDKFPGSYFYFTFGRQKTIDGGADCDDVPSSDDTEEERRTTVQLLDGGVPIVGGADNYLRYMIDLVFFPTTSHITAVRINLFDEILNTTTYQNPIKGAYRVMREAELSVAQSPSTRELRPEGPYEERETEEGNMTILKYVPMISGAFGGTFINFNETKAQFQAGMITQPRKAAEYIHLFVSDHLPLVATIPV